jgi:hypothetical protein
LPTHFPTLQPSAKADFRTSVPTLDPTRAVVSLNVRSPLESPVRVNEGRTSTVLLSAIVQGDLSPTTIMVRCDSSNATLLHVGCPDVPLVGSPASCDIPMDLPAGNLSLRLIAVDDFHNSGHPAVKNASLRCSSGTSTVVVREASVRFSITNVVRPIFGNATFKPSGENTTRRVLSGGTFEVVTTKAGKLILEAHNGFSSPPFISPSAALVREASASATGRRLVLDVPVNISDSTPTRLSLELPSFAAACGDENGNESMCLFGLEISNSEPPDPELGIAGNFSCPGRLENGEQVAACFAAIGASLSPSHGGRQTHQYHVIRYVPKCREAQGATEEPYEEPGSAVCSASIESAQKCAFGLGDTCKRCPYGAICPGGNEARSFPGFFTVDSAKGIVEPCIEPASERCVGWDAQTLATRCGDAYAGACSATLRVGGMRLFMLRARLVVTCPFRCSQARCAKRAPPASTCGPTECAGDVPSRSARPQPESACKPRSSFQLRFSGRASLSQCSLPSWSV